MSALPKVAGTTVALQRAGFTTSEIEQMQAEWSQNGLLNRLADANIDERYLAQAVASSPEQPAEDER